MMSPTDDDARSGRTSLARGESFDGLFQKEDQSYEGSEALSILKG